MTFNISDYCIFLFQIEFLLKIFLERILIKIVWSHIISNWKYYNFKVLTLLKIIFFELIGAIKFFRSGYIIIKFFKMIFEYSFHKIFIIISKVICHLIYIYNRLIIKFFFIFKIKKLLNLFFIKRDLGDFILKIKIIF